MLFYESIPLVLAVTCAVFSFCCTTSVRFIAYFNVAYAVGLFVFKDKLLHVLLSIKRA